MFASTLSHLFTGQQTIKVSRNNTRHRVMFLPLRIAEFPDLIANAAIFAMTSGRASKIMSKTPIGQLTLSKTSPSSTSVRRVTFPTLTPSVKFNENHSSETHSDPLDPAHSIYPATCHHTFQVAISRVASEHCGSGHRFLQHTSRSPRP